MFQPCSIFVAVSIWAPYPAWYVLKCVLFQACFLRWPFPSRRSAKPAPELWEILSFRQNMKFVINNHWFLKPNWYQQRKYCAQPITKLGEPQQRQRLTAQAGCAIQQPRPPVSSFPQYFPISIKDIFSPFLSILVSCKELQKNQMSWSAQHGMSTQKLTFWSRGPLTAGTFQSWPGEGDKAHH